MLVLNKTLSKINILYTYVFLNDIFEFLFNRNLHSDPYIFKEQQSPLSLCAEQKQHLGMMLLCKT